jgi:ssDNA-binding Zn-finger/Zn-ribbon topoisomerase 1
MSVCKIKAGNLLFELEVTEERALFEQLSHIQEVFDHKCEKCQNTDVRFRVREVADNKYYEMTCPKCHARLSFGCHKNGKTLFPKRKDEENNRYPDYGWRRWDREQNKEV